jgi:hypothetical protein
MMEKHSFFYGQKKIGEIESAGHIDNPQNAGEIMPVIGNLPAFLSNSLPEGERYENLLLASPKKQSKNKIDIAADLDELPGNFSLDTPEIRKSLPFPEIDKETLFIGTTLPGSIFFVESEIRRGNKPSFSGYQDKFTAMISDQNGQILVRLANQKEEIGNVLVKPGIKLPFIGENEFFCMKLAQKAGFNGPKIFLIQNPDPRLSASHFCIERFDIYHKNGDVEKRGTLEFATLMKLKSEDKYSARTEDLFQEAQKVLPKEDLETMAKAYMYGVIIGNGDMHTKNFSVFVENGQCNLTPIYDMLNTKIHGFSERLALSLNGKNNFNPAMKDIITFMEKYITKNDIAELLETVENNMPPVLDFVFDLSSNQDDFHARKRHEFGYRLESDINDNIEEAKQVLRGIQLFLPQRTHQGQMREDTAWVETLENQNTEERDSNIRDLLIVPLKTLGEKNMKKLRDAQKQNNTVQFEKTNGKITVKTHEEVEQEKSQKLNKDQGRS